MADAIRQKDDDDEALGSAFLVYKPVRVDQLVREVADAENWRKDPVLTVQGDVAAASNDAPLTVWIDRTDGDDKVFIDTVNKHTPDPAWTDTALDTPPTPPPAVTTDLATLASKVSAGEGLDSNEQSAAVAALVTDWAQRQESPKK